MSESNEISSLLHQIRDGGSESAIEKIWNNYHQKLLSVSKRKLTNLHSRVADEEDVALAAFGSFVRRLKRGDFAPSINRDEARKILITIAVRKALNLVRDSNRKCRRPENRLIEGMHTQDRDITDRAATPDAEVMVADSVQHLLNSLDSDELREIAISKMAGYTNREIAEALNRSIATIERRLQLIRLRWQKEIT